MTLAAVHDKGCRRSLHQRPNRKTRSLSLATDAFTIGSILSRSDRATSQSMYVCASDRNFGALAEEIGGRAMNRKPLILCADDSLSVLEGWKMLLERNGYDVLTASDGTEAFQEFVSHPVDLVLLDYHMPHMNGDVAAAHMQSCKTDVPIALFSADDLSELNDLETVDAFISKSEPIPRVLETVEQLLSRRFLFRRLDPWERQDAP
jgi:CheY-like chemotaxis protein